MRLRKKWWAKPEMEKDMKVITTPSHMKSKWKENFGSHNPIHLELGCGKGQFITSLAEKNPAINYIAVDYQYEVLIYLLRKANEKKIENLRIIPMDITHINDVFDRDEIDRIYINFCNPWPKVKHNKRRLTHIRYLDKYMEFLKSDSEIWFKTDDDMLFTDSLEYFQNKGFLESYKTVDLHNSGFENNVMTEYEEKFSNMDIAIKFSIFKKGTL
ncbi:MAG: tRNA (guanosine(46)-N7)-methyltransferase TrmB [Eubacteriaceae bacterium]|nr:tRNA (guanosine(46)-N7)-methyltransferase TrmB [Eubacteriaceae bacterium]